MLVVQAYANTWNMCLFMFGFFVAVSAAALLFRSSALDIQVPAKPVFWISAIAWLIFMGVCLTLIDKPHLDLSAETKDWLFMFCAFLFIPLTCPLLAGAAWALAYDLREEEIPLGALSLVMLGAFALGCAASNLHDVAWCGIITSGYTQHFKAGYDLDVFATFAKWFGIPKEIASDYMTLGPCALVLVIGELLVAAATYLRLKRIV